MAGNEERLDSHAKELKDHEKRLIREEEKGKRVDEKLGDLHDDFTCMRSEIMDYLKPIKTLTERNHGAIIKVETDMTWIKPWVKRTMGVTATSLLGLFGLWYQNHTQEAKAAQQETKVEAREANHGPKDIGKISKGSTP